MSLAVRLTGVSLVLSLAFATPATAAADPSPRPTSRVEASPSSRSSSSSIAAGMRIVVRFRSDATAAQIDDAVHSVNGWIDLTIPAIGITRIALPGGADDAVGDGPAVAAALAKHPAVASAEYDALVRLSFTPNDTYWTTDPFVGLGQWGLRKALVDQAWDKVRASSSIVVASLDTGVDLGHPDLQGVLSPGTVKLSQPSAECAPNLTTRDDDGHGTHVAGIIGAAGNNGAGIAGVAFGAKVMPVKVLDCTGVGESSDVAAGLIWAVDQGARIVNISLGSPFASSVLRSAVTYASSHNVLVVAAAGNCAVLTSPCTTLNQLDYPAAYPEVLAVGATDTDDSLTVFSSRNSSVGVVAPGRRIVSTTPTYATYLSSRVPGWTLSYAPLNGTSQAAPLVAGLAALVWSGEPTLTAQQVFQRIEATADQIEGAPGTRNDGYGYGRVNALRAVSAAANPASTPTPPVAGGQDSAVYSPLASAASFPVLVPGGRADVALTLTNSGTSTWTSGGATPVHIAAHVSDAKGSVVIWDGVRTPLLADVPPGGKVDVKVSVDAPAAPGPYRARIDLVREGVAWFSSLGVPTSDLDLLVAPDYRAVFSGSGSVTVSKADPTTTVTIKNTSIATWTTTGAAPVDIGVHWYDAGGNVLVWDGPRTPLPGALAPDQSVTVAVRLGAPPAGAAFVTIDLVSEGIAWFGQGPLRQVTLAP